MGREPLMLHAFALLVVRDTLGRVLLVEERDGSWYLPAGRLEPGETFAEGALRECLEESGVPVVLSGVIRVEQGVATTGVRLRVFFLARPAGDPTPKATSDEHSRRAAWFTTSEVAGLPVRSPEVHAAIRAVESGTPILPLSAFTSEGTAWE